MKYAGSLVAGKGEPIKGSSFSDGNVFQVKTKNVNVILNRNGIAFPADFDEMFYIDTAASYTFSEDTVLAYGTFVEVI